MNEQHTAHPMRQWRKDAGKTLADVASAVGVTPSHLSEIERYENEPSLSLAAKLSEMSKIPLDGFVKKREAAE